VEGRSAGLKRALGLLVVVSCGGAEAPAAPAQPPPREMMALVVRADRGDPFCQALEASLARSGFTIANSMQPADAILSCNTYASADDGFIHITQNGEPRQHFTVRVQVRSPQNAPVDQFIAEYSGFRSSGPDEEAIAKVVVAFSYSGRMAAFARNRAAQPAVVAQSVVTATVPIATVEPPPPPTRDPRDDAAWFAIDTVRCKAPPNAWACNPVRSYLQRFPQGAHAQEATDMLTVAQPALERLQKDENAWARSRSSDCSRRHTKDACVGVEAYDIQFPNGMHSEEAHRLLKAAGSQ